MKLSMITAALLGATALNRLAFDGGLKAFYTDEGDVPDEFKALYTKKGERWELSVEIPGINGVKSFSDFNNLNEALRKERNDHKGVKDRLKVFGTRSLEEVVTELDRIPELETELEAAKAGGKVPDAKINELVEKRLEGKLAPVKRELETTKTALGEAQSKIKDFEGKDLTRQIHDAVRSAATKAKILPTAMEDALSLGERLLHVEDGKVIVKDDVGYTPGVGAEVLFTELQSRRPHWWGESSGGGARGSGGGGFAKNPWSAESWNMTEQGAIVRSDPAKAEQMAKAAGTTVGGKKPQPKK